MRSLLRALLVLALLWLAAVIYMEIRELAAAENVNPESVGEQSSRVVVLFVYLVAVGLVIAGVVAFWVLPALGDRIADAVYSPDEKVERDPHADAVALVNAGDYAGAAEEYRKMFKENPEDILALTEFVHLSCDKLDDCQSAATLLETELEREWPPDHAALLSSRLVDVYWDRQHDAIRSRALLIQIAENMPGTKHAANAQHRLREIDRVLMEEEAALPPPGAAPAPGSQENPGSQ